jgi:hypothetical protein
LVWALCPPVTCRAVVRGRAAAGGRLGRLRMRVHLMPAI